MERGKIIILNGTSSSGKTSIVRALQDRLAEPWMVRAWWIEMLPAGPMQGRALSSCSPGVSESIAPQK